MGRHIIGITGASGSIYGIKLINVLLKLGEKVELVITDAGKRVISEELNLDIHGTLGNQHMHIAKFFRWDKDGFALHDIGDIDASIASGSYRADDMVIIPCSMGTLASIAGGLSSNLLERAADVSIKEGRKLCIIPRETPFNTIHLENMLRLSRMGVRIIPAMPAFYTNPQNINEITDFIVGKVLDQLGIEYDLYDRWKS